MTRVLTGALGAVLLLIVLLIAAGGARALASPRPRLRGELVDIGGRRLRIVCEGPRSDLPLVVTESGIFGFAADWGEVQKALAAQGIRSCAYDRAGLGYSDRGPNPRDGLAIVTDLEKLLKAHGETGPLVLVGHSMAGLHTRLFALRNPDRVKGLVLVDAMSPDVAMTGQGRQRLETFNTFANQVRLMSSLGVLKAIAPKQGDTIELKGAAHDEKVWFFGDNRFNQVGAEETHQAGAAAAQALAAGHLSPDLPVAVVTEGPREVGQSDWGKGRNQAALQSKHGFVENVEGASHANLLGYNHAGVIVHAVREVMDAAGYGPQLKPEAGK